MFATAVDDWLTTVASANVSPGITLINTSPYREQAADGDGTEHECLHRAHVVDVMPDVGKVRELGEHPEEDGDDQAEHRRAADQRTGAGRAPAVTRVRRLGSDPGRTM